MSDSAATDRSPRDVVITGIGLVSSLGEGVDTHLSALTAAEPRPVVESEAFAPYSVHPLQAIDWARQIPKRGDLRQMETWQKLGTYAAGLALEDAGIPADEAVRATIDMIVSAGGGERDMTVDALLMERARHADDVGPVVNETLSSELRPTLFLAQLSNLLAGNISIVHKVTGSSRTFMGEEAAGISAVALARSRIAAGQSDICLVGGSFSAERKDLILNFDLAGLMLKHPFAPVPERGEGRDGLVPGSVGAFLILEEAGHAAARGATVYAKLTAAGGDRGSRADPGRAASRLAATIPAFEADEKTVVFSAASGLHDLATVEDRALGERAANAPVRHFGTMLGHSFEAHVPAGVALAAATLARKARLAPFSAGEAVMTQDPERVLVTVLGHLHAEGALLVEAFDAAGS